MKHVKYILIDETSFIGRNILIKNDSRLLQDFPKNVSIPFGGSSIILVGDLGQLPLFISKYVDEYESLAKELWKSFTIVVALDIVFQQYGQSNDKNKIQHLLMNVRDEVRMVEDGKLLMACTDTSLDTSTK